jgi:hypothetical protein
MRVCPKCSKRSGDENKICRNCGAILDDVVVAELSQGEEPDWCDVSSRAESPVIGVDGTACFDEPDASIDPDISAWKCPQCGEIVPGTFDVCWKCYSSSKEDGTAVRGESLSAEQMDDEDEQIEPAEQHTEDVGTDNEEQPEIKCPRCGSSQVAYGVTVVDQGDNSDGHLQVVVVGDPQALIFKDRLYGTLQADICGQCGHVELRVANFRELYRHYRKSFC